MKRVVLVALIGWLATFGAGPHAQSRIEAPLPATPAGRALAELLMAYHAEGAAEIERFFERRASESDAEQRRRAVERRAAWVANIRRGYRDLRIDRIERSAEHEVVVLCQSKITQAWCKLELEVDAEPPHGVAIGFTYADPPPTQRSERTLGRAEVVRALDAYVATLVTAGMFSGVVTVATDGKAWFAKAYGRTRSVDEKFSLASASKMFTAVAIAQLAQQRKLAFTDTIGQHVKDYPRREVAERVTIEQLLTHTSGLGDYMENPAFRSARQAGGRFASPRDYFPYFANDPLLFPPGERFEYSNAGYIVLGEIIERVSGLGYFDYITRHILQHAGMTSTDPRGKTGSPAGSAVSTAGDLVRFAQALRGYRLLDAGHTKLVLAPRTDAAFGASYAYGFFVRHRGTRDRIAGHDGENPGVNALLDMYLERGHTVVVLSDDDPPAARNIASKLETLLLTRRR